MIDLLIFLVPAYVGNSSPVVLGGGAPLDLGKKIGGKRILGKGKTIRGFAGGVVAGTLAAIIIAQYYQLPFFENAETQMIGGFLLAFGTLFGDSFGSFLKRRMNMESGSPFFPDTFIFLFFALLFVSPLVHDLFEPFNIAFFFILTMILHPLTNLIANKAGLKRVPW